MEAALLVLWRKRIRFANEVGKRIGGICSRGHQSSQNHPKGMSCNHRVSLLLYPAADKSKLSRVMKPIDAHVHVVGNGSGGSGCWVRVRGWHRPLVAIMLRHIGLPLGALS